MYHFSI